LPLSGPLIREKAKYMHDHQVALGGAANMSYSGMIKAIHDACMSDAGKIAPSHFPATRGWFDHFKI